MNQLYIYILILLTPAITISQLTFINPGFEGVPITTITGQGEMAPPWQNCMPFGQWVDPYGFYATPDMQPYLNDPIYEIILAPSEGDKYISATVTNKWKANNVTNTYFKNKFIFITLRIARRIEFSFQVSIYCSKS